MLDGPSTSRCRLAAQSALSTWKFKSIFNAHDWNISCKINGKEWTIAYISKYHSIYESIYILFQQIFTIMNIQLESILWSPTIAPVRTPLTTTVPTLGHSGIWSPPVRCNRLYHIWLDRGDVAETRSWRIRPTRCCYKQFQLKFSMSSIFLEKIIRYNTETNKFVDCWISGIGWMFWFWRETGWGGLVMWRGACIGS